jgi:hypothetical protein
MRLAARYVPLAVIALGLSAAACDLDLDGLGPVRSAGGDASGRSGGSVGAPYGSGDLEDWTGVGGRGARGQRAVGGPAGGQGGSADGDGGGGAGEPGGAAGGGGGVGGGGGSGGASAAGEDLDGGAGQDGGDGAPDAGVEPASPDAAAAAPPADGGGGEEGDQPGDGAAVEREPPCPRGHPDLALCLRFEGSVVDDSQNAHALTPGAVTFERGVSPAGPVNLVGRFGPVGGVSIPESAALDSARVTVEAWLSPRVLPAAGTQMGVVDNNDQYGLFLRPGGTLACIGRGTAAAAAVVRPGVWTSVACTFDEAAVAIWVNGVPYARVVSTGPPAAGGTTGTSVGQDNPVGSPFEGVLDNVRIWRAVRTEEEICGGAIVCRR